MMQGGASRRKTKGEERIKKERIKRERIRSAEHILNLSS